MTTTLKNWSLALLMALVLGAAHHLDGPDYSADWAEAEAIEARQQEAAASARRDFAAQQACGPNAAFEWVSDTSIQCFTKRGRKAGKVVQL